MRAWIFSDLHVDATPWTPPSDMRADIAIIAGDVADRLTRRAIPWLKENVCPRARAVVYTPGNHDFWRTRMPDELARAREDAAAAEIALLDAGQTFDFEEPGSSGRRCGRTTPSPATGRSRSGSPATGPAG